jgi:hypothetical protein
MKRETRLLEAVASDVWLNSVLPSLESLSEENTSFVRYSDEYTSYDA